MRLEAEKNGDETYGRNGVANTGRFGTPGVYSKKMGSESMEMRGGSFTMKFKIRLNVNGNRARSFN